MNTQGLLTDNRSNFKAYECMELCYLPIVTALATFQGNTLERNSKLSWLQDNITGSTQNSKIISTTFIFPEAYSWDRTPRAVTLKRFLGGFLWQDRAKAMKS